MVRKQVRRMNRFERHAAIDCQRIWRGWLGRKRAWLKRAGIAATKVQALWRGVTTRALLDRDWLSNEVCS